MVVIFNLLESMFGRSPVVIYFKKSYHSKNWDKNAPEESTLLHIENIFSIFSTMHCTLFFPNEHAVMVMQELFRM